MAPQSTFLLFGATGGTGKHFTTLALQNNHRIRAVVRDPSKLRNLLPQGTSSNPNLEIHTASITTLDSSTLDTLLKGVDYVVVMLGDRLAQQESKINTAFIHLLVPSMRRQGVKRLLYQAGGFSVPPNASLAWAQKLVRNTVISSFRGQHEDNEAVMEYLDKEARDIEWIVHRAGINPNGGEESKGRLERSGMRPSVGNFLDCAEYSHRLVRDDEAIHTCDFSRYV